MMKKNSKPKKQNTRDEELRTLDSQLGSFGLEPPKIYRHDQKAGSKSEHRRRTQKDESVSPQEKNKQQNKKRRLKKGVRRAIYGVSVFVCVALVLVVLSLTVLFKIDNINISGNKFYTTQQISAVLPLETGKNLFTSDLSGAKVKLEENLPYIYEATLTRKFPSTVSVVIKETPKVYQIKNADNTYTLLDDRFKVLEAKTGNLPKDCIEVRKAAIKTAVAGKTVQLTSDKVLECLISLCEVINKVEIDKVTAIYSQDINNNFIVYDGRITIKLGSLDNAEEKLYSALTAIDKLTESNPKAEGELTAISDKQVYFTEK